MIEPRIHSHIEDCLPDRHRLAYRQVYCDEPFCTQLLHAQNNECMQTWLESGGGNFCWEHACKRVEPVLSERMALPSPGEPKGES